MTVRFYLDPATGFPHIHIQGVNEEEVMEVLENAEEDRPGVRDREWRWVKPVRAVTCA